MSITGAHDTLDAAYRTEARRVLSTLIRLLGDFDAAEEGLHDAFAAAAAQWPRRRHPLRDPGPRRVDGADRECVAGGLPDLQRRLCGGPGTEPDAGRSLRRGNQTGPAGGRTS